MPTKKSSAENPSFEKLFAELERVVAKLESGNLTLDESLALFQRGMELTKKCGRLLDTAELRVQELTPATSENIMSDAMDADDEAEG